MIPFVLYIIGGFVSLYILSLNILRKESISNMHDYIDTMNSDESFMQKLLINLIIIMVLLVYVTIYPFVLIILITEYVIKILILKHLRFLEKIENSKKKKE